VYLAWGRLFWGARNIDGRGFDEEDNRPTNLELWTRPQPAGIRVSDGIAWALEILDRHLGEGADAPPTMLAISQALLEVAGVEPASSETSMGLLRAHPGKSLGPPSLTGGERRPQPQ